MPLFHLAYLSTAATPLALKDLLPILEISRDNNQRTGITGILLYRDGRFVQLLEGEESAVRDLYAVIGKDPRHHDVVTLFEGPITERRFSEWLMGFRDLTLSKIGRLEGFSEILNRDWSFDDLSEAPARTQELLDILARQPCDQ